LLCNSRYSCRGHRCFTAGSQAALSHPENSSLPAKEAAPFRMNRSFIYVYYRLSAVCCGFLIFMITMHTARTVSFQRIRYRSFTRSHGGGRFFRSLFRMAV
jgi:hypothetical protein